MENRLNNIIFKFLDVKYGALEQKKGRYRDIIFYFPGDEYGKLGWNKSGDLYVFYELVDEISNYFGLESNDSLRVIGKWVEGRYNLKVTNTATLNVNEFLIVEGRYNLKVTNTIFNPRINLEDVEGRYNLKVTNTFTLSG